MASGLRSIYAGSEEIQNNCGVCLTRKKTSKAKSYCKECEEHLCQICEKAHRTSRATKLHTILTGSSIPSGSTKKKNTVPIMFCDSHKTSLLEIYCKTHDDVICNMCKMGSHIKCNTVDVSHHASNSNEAGTFRTVVNSLADLQDRFTKLQVKRKEDRSTAKAQIKVCLQEVDQIRKDVNKQLDNLEKKMVAEIRAYEDKLQKEIDRHEAMSKNVLQEIDKLKKSLDECQKTRDDDAMFIGMKRASSSKKEFEKIIENIMAEFYPINVCIEPNRIVTNLFDQSQTLGILLTGEQTQKTGHIKAVPKSLQKINVTNKQKEIDIGSDYVRGCTFMPDGHLVVACLGDGLKLFDGSFQFKAELHNVTSFDVAVINDNNVIVTQGSDKQIQRVQVLPIMEVTKPIKMDRACYGIDVVGAKIYTTCHDFPGNGEVRVMDMGGNTQRRFGIDYNTSKFKEPNRVIVSKDGSKLFVSDWDTNIVTCLNQQGQEIYQYSNKDLLQNPHGMYVDGEDNLLVCGLYSHNVHVIRQDGKREKILLSKKDGMWRPWSISYRQSDGCLAVLMGQEKDTTKLVVFTTKI